MREFGAARTTKLAAKLLSGTAHVDIPRDDVIGGQNVCGNLDMVALNNIDRLVDWEEYLVSIDCVLCERRVCHARTLRKLCREPSADPVQRARARCDERGVQLQRSGGGRTETNGGAHGGFAQDLSGRELRPITGVDSQRPSWSEVEASRRAIPQLYLFADPRALDRRDIQINARWDHDPIRLQQTFTCIVEVLEQAKFGAKAD